MCACGCNIDVECEGKKASVHCNRPRWEDVYKRYIEGEKHLRRDIAFLHGRSQQLLTSNAALVFYALKSVMNIDLFSFIADEKELKDWLYKNNVWGKADVEIRVSGEKDLVQVRRKIKWMSGIYIILGDAKNPNAHATLWDGSLKNAINEDNHLDKGGTVYFWELMKCNPTSNNPKVFSYEEFDKYIKYIKNNASKENNIGRRYGTGPNDWHDCIYTVVNSMRELLNLNEKTLLMVDEEQMDNQMKKMQSEKYADNWIEFDFNYETKPVSFKDKKLSGIVLSEISSEAGYYFFGLSIMDGHHSAMIVVNNINHGKPMFNIYDQFGSLIYKIFERSKRFGYNKLWYSNEEMDDCLLLSVQGGHPLYYPNGIRKEYDGKTITRVTPIKHNWEN